MALAREPQKATLAHGLWNNAYLILALASLCWSGNHLMGRAIAGHVPPLTISALRWLLAAALVYPFVRKQLATDWPLIRVSSALSPTRRPARNNSSRSSPAW